LTASKQCKKLRQTPWLPKVIQARNLVNILKRLLGMYRTHVDMKKSIVKLQRKAGRRHPLPSTKATCNTALRQAQSVLKTTVKAAAARRQEHLEDLAVIYALRKDKEKSAILKYLIKAEDIKSMYAKIRAIRKQNNKQGITTLEVPVTPTNDPKTCTQWQTVDLPEEILDLLQQRNQSHFGQANGTPFTVGTMKQDFDFEGATHTSELVLEGEYTKEETDAITSAVIRFAKKHTTLDSQSWCLTEAEFLAKYAAGRNRLARRHRAST
jgi:hypothetical protein